MSFFAILLAGLIDGPPVVAATPVPPPLTIGIEIRDVDSNALLATGTESIVETGGTIVREASYRGQDGIVVQTESCAYRVKDGKLTSYSYLDRATGEQVSIASDGPGAVRVAFQEGKDKKEGLVPWTEDTLHGKVIPERLLVSWEKLMAGETITFDLLVASRLETIRFRGRYDEATSARTQRPTFLVDANNPLIRLFAPDFRFVFDDARSRRVIEYVGPSPIEIGGKRYPTVRLTFAEL